ncbi:hypothetical protein A3F66_05525 [candidate division TM6 bacterium RIFCSPHIGHO2_12_FULL_32_22]|nr:MAG: hypothetical protein A3F66_05525 [candidate division TM6 bacterium RIFCSPHIGHO2_12_FULL_32_22]
MKHKLLIFSLFLIFLIVFGYYFCKDFGMQTITEQKENIINFVENNYLLSVIIYILSYILIVLSSLPLTALMTILGGVLYGVLLGTVFVLFSAITGSLLSILIFRTLLGKEFQAHYSGRLKKFNDNFERYGSRYLIMIHLFMIIPFFIINVLISMTHISFWTLIWTTFVGMFPSTILYTYAGHQLRIANCTAGSIFSWKIILLFIGLIVIGAGSIIFEHIKSKRHH